ncbi:hypothetical protein KR074_007172 [Drosophila pseudoananassae]|nr:hypothetical protein KR074_007172 [Drosophila pseudoananassae]
MDRITLDDLPSVAAAVRGMVEKHLEVLGKDTHAQLPIDREEEKAEMREEANKILGFRPSLDEDKVTEKETDSITDKGPIQESDQEGFRPEQDKEGKITKEDLMSLVMQELKATRVDNVDVEEAINPDIRRELVAKMRQELINESQKVIRMQKQLQETRQLVADYQERTKKVYADIQFIQLMTREVQRRIDKIEAARKKRAASK